MTPSAVARSFPPRVCGRRERCDWTWARKPVKCPGTPATWAGRYHWLERNCEQFADGRGTV